MERKSLAESHLLAIFAQTILQSWKDAHEDESGMRLPWTEYACPPQIHVLEL